LDPVRSKKQSEASLQLEAVIQTATDGIIIIDERGRMEMVNDAAARLFKYDLEEMEGQNVSMLMPPPDKNRHDQYISNYLKTGDAKIIGIGREVRGRKKDGTTFPLRLSISEVKLPERILFTGIVHDLTREKEAEAALREEKERAQTYFDMANTINVVLNTDCRVVEINKKGCAFLGDKPEDSVQGQNWFSLIYPEGPREVAETAFRQMMAEDIDLIDSYESKVVRHDGCLRDFAWKNSILVDDTFEVIGMISSGIDITDRKNAERELNQEKERAQQYLDVANTLFVAIDGNEQITLLNRKGSEILGYTEQEVMQKNWFDLVIPEGERDEKRQEFHTFLQSPNAKGGYFESSVVTKNGEIRLMAWHNALVRNEEEEVAINLLSGVDITEQRKAEKRIQEMNSQLEKRVELRTEELASAVNQLLNINKKMEFEIKERKLAEEALRKNQRELQKAFEAEKELSKLKSRFVSMASHEFRTPLSTILSSADLVEAYRKEEQQPKREKHTKRIKSAVSNLTGILNDFLSLSRLEEGAIHPDPIDCDLDKLSREVMDDLHGILKSDQDIAYSYEGQQDTVFLDAKMVKNVLINLLSNAIKYSEAGKTIKLRIDMGDDLVRLEVTDQGIGIPEEEQQHLFTRFFRAHNVENIQGTGLGLNIVKRYVDLMGGQITFESRLGEGTTFAVRLPKRQET
jgi:PAS domain S-box-containing protein